MTDLPSVTMRIPLPFSGGRAAERRAARYLRGIGFDVVERNARTAHGEIDIVCVDGDTVVLVEVRFRRRGLGAALDSIDAGKRRSLRRAAREYLRQERLRHTPARIDLVALTRDEEGWILRHRRAVVALDGAGQSGPEAGRMGNAGSGPG